MKNSQLFFVFVITLFSGFPLFAQDDVYTIIARETCECISKKDIDLTKKKQAQMTLGLCLIERANANKLEMDLTNEETMRELGKKIGVIMVGFCPDVFSAFVEEEEEAVEEGPVYESVSGVVKSVDTGDFIYLVVKEKSGKEHKFIWLQYFSGSDEFAADPRSLKGKKVTVYYQTWEVFSPVSKTYYNSKEITELVIE